MIMPDSHVKKVAAGAMLILAMTLVAYIPGMRGDFIWDDDANITANPNMRTLEGLKETWVNPRANQQYYPVTHTSFWIEYQIWGLKPFPFHVTNVLLHSVSAILLWVLLRRLRVPGAWFAAGIFALHPVHAESVAWITERKNNLSVMFYLASMLAYVRFAGLDEGEGGGEWVAKWRIYLVSFVFFVLAFLAKSVTVTLPIALGIITWWKRGRLSFRDVIYLAPMVMLGAGMGWLTEHLEQHHVGALGWEWEIPFLAKVIVAGRSCWFFVGKLLWPSNLIFVYPRWNIDAGQVAQYIYPVGAVILLLTLYLLRRRIGRGPLAAVLYYGVTLSPAFSLLNVYFMRFSYVQDHFVYPASIGIIVLVCALLTAGLAKLIALTERREATIIVPIVYACVLAVLGTLTWRHGYIYRNNEVLWRDTIAKNPKAWIAQYNLGNILMERGHVEEAIKHFRAAMKANRRLPEPPINLALALTKLGHYDEAIAQYRKVLAAHPRSAAAHNNLGMALAEKGRYDEAIKHYTEALKLEPDYAEAHYNLGVVLAKQGEKARAEEQYREALRCNPDYELAHVNLGVLLAESGDTDRALYHFSQALSINPSSADTHNNIGIALASKGQLNQAADHFREAVRLRPAYPEAHFNLGSALAALGDQEGALKHFLEAVRLKPDYPQAHFNLAVAYYYQGDYKRAWDEVNLCRRYGMSPAPGFLQALEQKMPMPRL